MKTLSYLLLFFTIVSCQSTKKTTIDSSGELLWKIEKEGLPATSYLFGTIHLIPEEEYFLPNDVSLALQNSKCLVLEADIDIPIKEQLAMAPKMMLPQGKSYTDYMSMREFNTLRSYMIDSLEIREGKVDRYMMMKPFYLLSVLLTEHYPDLKMYEKELTSLAKKNDLQIKELEGIYYQLNLIDSAGIDMMFPTAEDLDIVNGFEKLLEAYKHRNLDEIYDVAMSEIDTTNAEDLLVERLLIQRRNSEWIGKIEKLIGEEASFIAVGCAHLCGENGLVNRLKEEGYTLTPMEF